MARLILRTLGESQGSGGGLTALDQHTANHGCCDCGGHLLRGSSILLEKYGPHKSKHKPEHLNRLCHPSVSSSDSNRYCSKCPRRSTNAGTCRDNPTLRSTFPKSGSTSARAMITRRKFRSCHMLSISQHMSWRYSAASVEASGRSVNSTSSCEARPLINANRRPLLSPK